MALVIAKSEPHHHIIGIDTSVEALPITPDMRLDAVTSILRQHGGGGTNLALPMEYALRKKLIIDAFVILTDNESWQGRHPALALEEYRKRINPNAQIVSVQMAATHVTNNDPNDKRALDVCGFDTATPEIINGFLSGRF
jgi:60 kDa SS-A/Ro ribonucleoprotein